MKYRSIGDMFTQLAPIYHTKTWRPFVASFKWDASMVDVMYEISAKRCDDRKRAYIIDGELDRSKGSIRFGNIKKGHGHFGERTDFCLVGGSLYRGTLTAFYRSINLIGGLHFDLPIFREVEKALGPVSRIQIMAARCDVLCIPKNSNEKLYHRLMAHYAE